MTKNAKQAFETNKNKVTLARGAKAVGVLTAGTAGAVVAVGVAAGVIEAIRYKVAIALVG